MNSFVRDAAEDVWPCHLRPVFHTISRGYAPEAQSASA